MDCSVPDSNFTFPYLVLTRRSWLFIYDSLCCMCNIAFFPVDRKQAFAEILFSLWAVSGSDGSQQSKRDISYHLTSYSYCSLSFSNFQNSVLALVFCFHIRAGTGFTMAVEGIWNY